MEFWESGILRKWDFEFREGILRKLDKWDFGKMGFCKKGMRGIFDIGIQFIFFL